MDHFFAVSEVDDFFCAAASRHSVPDCFPSTGRGLVDVERKPQPRTAITWSVGASSDASRLHGSSGSSLSAPTGEGKRGEFLSRNLEKSVDKVAILKVPTHCQQGRIA